MNSQKRKIRDAQSGCSWRTAHTVKGAFAEMVASYGFALTASWRLLMHACCLDVTLIATLLL